MKYVFVRGGLVVAALLSACSDSSIVRQPVDGARVQASTIQYTCPMHPHFVSTDPDQPCPICGMNLVPVSSGDRSSDDSIIVAPEMIQTMGIRIRPVQMIGFGRPLRAFGVVQTNQRLENAVASRLEGWIENLAVRAVGDTVSKGDVLYRVYSPDLIGAQTEYLSALPTGDKARIAAVAQRLLSLGMQKATIDQVTGTRRAIEHIPVYAESNGVVTELTVRQGDYIRPGTPILRLQSYASVWVMASIPERDLPLVTTGLDAGLSFPSAPHGPLRGTVDYIYPTIDPRTRTARVRIEVDNTDGLLRPGAYANITMESDHTTRLSVPVEAVLRDSRGAHVIVALGEGRFAGRAVRTGIVSGDVIEILDGLSLGEQVVSSGQFLLDSEVNLREGLAKLEVPSADRDTPLSALSVDASALLRIDHLIDMALYFHEALTDRYRIDPAFVDPALDAGQALKTRFADTGLFPILEQAETALRMAQEATDSRALASELARLTEALEPWMTQGAPERYRDAGLTLFRETGSDQLWLQEGDTPVNPYGDNGANVIAWPESSAGPTDIARHSAQRSGHRH